MCIYRQNIDPEQKKILVATFSFFIYTHFVTFFFVALLRIGVVLKLPSYSSHCVPLFLSCIYLFVCLTIVLLVHILLCTLLNLLRVFSMSIFFYW